jgi:hypothetical protein
MRRRATGISVDALVRREGAAPIVAGRRAHRCRPAGPSLLAAAAVVASVVAGASTLVLMPDDGAQVHPVQGEPTAARRVVPPPAAPPAPIDDVEQQVVSAEQITAVPRTAAAAPRSTPTEQPRPTPTPERPPSLRTEDLELTDEIDELATQLMKGTGSSGSHGRKGLRRRGPKDDPNDE